MKSVNSHTPRNAGVRFVSQAYQLGCRLYDAEIRVPLLAGTEHFLPAVTPGMHGAEWLP